MSEVIKPFHASALVEVLGNLEPFTTVQYEDPLGVGVIRDMLLWHSNEVQLSVGRDGRKYAIKGLGYSDGRGIPADVVRIAHTHPKGYPYPSPQDLYNYATDIRDEIHPDLQKYYIISSGKIVRCILSPLAITNAERLNLLPTHIPDYLKETERMNINFETTSLNKIEELF